ncbi:MAG: peroxidase family protein [Saprospiraceae bacterium]
MKKFYNRATVSCAVALMSLAFSQEMEAQEYRTIDGSNNNPVNVLWGVTDAQMQRWDTACYGDSISTPAGANRPNPREISNALFDQNLTLIDPTGLSDFCWVFGQFIDHDITLTPDGSELALISVPMGDPSFDPFNTGTSIIPMHRSEFVVGTGTSIANPREHANAITTFMDGSGIYGSDQTRADWLRTFSGGKLKSSAGNLLPYNTLTGENSGSIDINAPHMDNPVGAASTIFVAGDARCNENTLLITMHTLFMREHNRQCDVIAAANPGLSDQQLYLKARQLTSGIVQSIFYNEWMPAVGIELPTYQGYDQTVNPAIANTFAAAAFRMGHTLLNGDIRRLHPDGTPFSGVPLDLKDAYFNPASLPAAGGVEPFLKGMAEQTQQSFDAQVIDDVRNFLFGRPGQGGLDLASININRGRERGLPDYNSIREALGLTRINQWSEVIDDLATISTLQSLYGGLGDVDPWVGMLAEKAMPGKLFGPTVTEALARQFIDIRDGDRFFYLGDPNLSTQEQAIITSTRMSDVIRRNTDVVIMQGNVFTSMNHSNVPVCAAATAEEDLQVVISLPDGRPLESADVIVYGMDDVLPVDTTNALGFALFSDLPTCDDYAVEGFYEGILTAGVTTYDMYLIGQHVLGITEFSSPYVLLAADVNRNGSISAFDLTNIRRAILGLETTFGGSPAWRFIDPSVQPGVNDNPLTFAWERKAHLNLFNGSATADLIAIKAGDVNNSFSFQQPTVGPRTAKFLAVSADLDEDTKVTVQFEAQGLVAAQYRLQLNGGERIASVDGLPQGAFVVSDDQSSISVALAGDELNTPFVIRFNEAVEQLVLDESYTAEAYDANGTSFSLALKQSLGGLAQSSEVTFSPTILKEQSVLRSTNEASLIGATIIATDALGRMVLNEVIGSESFELRRSDLPANLSGSLIYSIEGPQIQPVSGILLLAD